MDWPAPRLSRSCCGFTLTEVVLVLVIIGVVAAIAVPRYAQSAARYRVQLAAAQVVADLAMARRFAKLTGGSETISFNPVSESYSFSSMDNPDRVGTKYAVSLSSEPYRVDLVSVDFGGDGQLVFDGYGTPDSGGSVSLRIGQRSVSVTVDPDTGRATASALSDAGALEQPELPQ